MGKQSIATLYVSHQTRPVEHTRKSSGNDRRPVERCATDTPVSGIFDM